MPPAAVITWGYSQELNNTVAKAILAYLAARSLDDACDEALSVKTICLALDLSESSVRKNITFLVDRGLVTKTISFGDDGGQLPSKLTLNYAR